MCIVAHIRDSSVWNNPTEWCILTNPLPSLSWVPPGSLSHQQVSRHGPLSLAHTMM